MLSEIWIAQYAGFAPFNKTGAKMQIEILMDKLSTRQAQLEITDRQCIKDARKYKASGARLQFRNKMLEHRRLQAQLTQLQRYRETALAHLDAVSNHEINQTFLRAIQHSGLKGLDQADTKKAMDNLHDTMKEVREMSDLLGEPVLEDVDDEDLESEFMEFSASETTTTPPVVETVLIPALPEVPVAKPEPVQPPLMLRTTPFGV